MSTLVLTAHGSADPRSGATARAVAGQIRRLRPWLDVREAFCEQTSPNLRDVLAHSADPVVTPLLLASAYHARVDIPAMIADSTARQADVLGEDERLRQVMHQRLAESGVSRDDSELGVLVVAVGSSWDAVNARTAGVADALAAEARWAGAVTAFATGPRPSVEAAAQRLRRRGAARIVIAPWFLAHGRITDRVANFARANGIAMAEPLGAHPLVAETVLDRFDQAVAERIAA
jgi:sirohydrochlorin ferrochelatase